MYALDYFYLTFFFDVAQCYLLLKAIKPDVLYINSGGYPGAVSCRATGIAGLLAGVKIIYFHVNSMPKPAPALFERLVDRLLIENVCRFITASHAVAEALSRQRRIPPAHVQTIHNSFHEVEPNVCRREEIRLRHGISDETILFGVVGELIERKGYRVVFDALHQLKKEDQITHLSLLVIGSGKLLSTLKKLVQVHGLGSTVTFVAHTDRIHDYYQAIDVLIMASLHSEDLPYVILEAMAAGKPVIGSAVAGIPEQVIHGVNGLLVDPGDFLGLSEAMIFFKKNFDAVRSMGAKSKELYHSKFHQSIAIPQIEQLFFNKKEQVCVSVIITTYNRSYYLSLALQSVLSQTYSNLDIIVLDDGSSDETALIVKKIDDPRIRFRTQEHSGRPALLRNRGMREAKGEYIAFLDDDDVWRHDKIQKQISYLNEHPQFQVVYSDCMVINQFGHEKGIMPNYALRKKGDVINDLLKGNFIPCPTVLFSRSLLSYSLIFPESPEMKAVEDYHFWLQLARVALFGYIAQPLAYYRIHSHGISTSLNYPCLRKRVLENMLSNPLWSDFYRHIETHIRKLAVAEAFFQWSHGCGKEARLSIMKYVRNPTANLFTAGAAFFLYAVSFLPCTPFTEICRCAVRLKEILKLW